MKTKFFYAIIFSIILFTFFVSQKALAAEHYVRDGAQGVADGSDWDNAYDILPATLIRGDTYYVADGDYGSYYFNDVSSGESFITIKKAIESSHGTDVGWNSSFGDGQAVWSKWDLDGSYYNLDGQVGGGPDTWKSGHGFKLYDANCPESSSCGQKKRFVEINNVPVSNINISHLEIEGCGTRRTSNGYEVRDEHFYATKANDRVTISYVWAYNTAGLHGLWLYPSNLNIEYSYFENQRYESGGTCSIHGESWNFRSGGADANTHIRWNVFKNFYGTAGLAFQDSEQGGYEIYGNVFYFDQFDGEYEAHTGTIFAGLEAHSDMLVYNNTFVDLRSPNLQSSRINIYGGTGNYARNNLWVNADRAGLNNDIIGTNNILDGQTSLFIDYNNDNFQLTMATDQGFVLSAPYNIDMYGKTRGADGVWDIGAFEYNGVISSCTEGETRSCETDDEGVCSSGTETCSSGVWEACARNTEPTDEICDNSLDDDCDGSVDEDCSVDPPLVIRSDVDDSGEVNSIDALLTLRKSLDIDITASSWQESSTTGDVNCDGVVGSSDALLLLRYSLGLDMSGSQWCG